MKLPLFITAVVALLTLLHFIFPSSEVHLSGDDGMVAVAVEIADDHAERSQGLMHRQGLGRNHGMLFIFPEPGNHAFWMKNTLIPLDIIFISPGLRVVDIIQALPCSADPCPQYVPKEAALYVLEVNSGFSEKNGISSGNRVTIYL